MSKHFDAGEADIGLDLSDAQVVTLTKSRSDGEPPVTFTIPKATYMAMIEHSVNGMTFQRYQGLAQRTEKELPTPMERLVHAQLGLTTESGEFADVIKGSLIYGKGLDPVHLQEELGDLLWYIALACNAMGVSLHQVAADNIAKLQRRYPDKYTDAAAIARADKT